jgi:hypothetical protein
LVIDDDALTRLLVQGNGFEIIEAENGQQGLELFASTLSVSWMNIGYFS